MATNLRNLLGLVDGSTVSRGFDSATKLPQFPMQGRSVQYISYMGCGSNAGGGQGEFNSYHWSYYKDWTVPTGATDIMFEIWGAGGSGAVSCCCSYGAPGGSGAYAYKRLTGDQVVPGAQYQICIAQSTCYTTSKAGRRGCPSYVLGTNLSNFCAEGGHGGCSYCFFQGCTWMTHRMCESQCKDGCCALFYGADGGAHGLPGATFAMCYINKCHNKNYFPYPGGLVNSYGGYVSTRYICSENSCNHCQWCNAGALVGWSHGQVGGGDYRTYVPGFGGASADSCTDGPWCGTNGTAGLARVSWK